MRALAAAAAVARIGSVRRASRRRIITRRRLCTMEHCAPANDREVSPRSLGAAAERRLEMRPRSAAAAMDYLSQFARAVRAAANMRLAAGFDRPMISERRAMIMIIVLVITMTTPRQIGSRWLGAALHTLPALIKTLPAPARDARAAKGPARRISAAARPVTAAAAQSTHPNGCRSARAGPDPVEPGRRRIDLIARSRAGAQISRASGFAASSGESLRRRAEPERDAVRPVRFDPIRSDRAQRAHN